MSPQSPGAPHVRQRRNGPLEQLPALYQLWGTHKVVLVKLGAHLPYGYQVESQRLVGREATGIFLQVLPGGVTAVTLMHPEQDTRVFLFPERKYGKRERLHNVSYEQRPIVAVEIHPAHVAPRVLVVDPKYRLEGEVGEGLTSDGKPKKGIDKLHAYRDAIRNERAGVWWSMPPTCIQDLKYPLMRGLKLCKRCRE